MYITLTISGMNLRNLSRWESLSKLNACTRFLNWPSISLHLSVIIKSTKKTSGIPRTWTTRMRLSASPLRKDYLKQFRKRTMTEISIFAEFLLKINLIWKVPWKTSITGVMRSVKPRIPPPRRRSLIKLIGKILIVSQALEFLIIIARLTLEREINRISLGIAAPRATVSFSRSQDT